MDRETVSAYMTRSPHSIGSDQTLAQAHRVLRSHRIRHLPVLQGGRLVGILSDRDLYWMETLKDIDQETVLVEEAMTPLPYAVTPQTPLGEVAREMAERKYGAAVVMEGPEVIGVFTTTDALRALADLIDEKKYTNKTPRRGARAAGQR